MPFVRRDASDEVVAISLEPAEGFIEVPDEAPELAEFRQRLGAASSSLAASDLEVIRVLDDLINVLINKNLLRFTDLPMAAQRKLMARRGLREHQGIHSLLNDDPGFI